MTEELILTESNAGPAPDSIALEHVFDIHYTLGQPIDLGTIATGRSVFFNTAGGFFKGPKIAGKVLSGGSDWTLTGADGINQIDANVILKTDDGGMIRASWLGRMKAESKTLTLVTHPQGRKQINPLDVYFRITPYFETSAKAYVWLNQSAFVASARFTEQGISYRVMRVL